MKIILTDLAPKLLDAWTEFFGNEENVSVVESDITKIKCDAIVSPANSFGLWMADLTMPYQKGLAGT
jgi:hypothetical protein